MLECDEGKPYSRAADPDMVMRASGGDRGRGRHSMSLMKPVKKMPAASMWTILPESMRGGRLARQYVRSANVGVAAPIQDGQEDHVEGVGAQVGGHGEVGVEGGRAQGVLHEGEVGRLPAHDGEQVVAHRMAPWWQSASVCRRTLAAVAGSWGRILGAQWLWCLLPASSRGSFSGALAGRVGGATGAGDAVRSWCERMEATRWQSAARSGHGAGRRTQDAGCWMLDAGRGRRDVRHGPGGPLRARFACLAAAASAASTDAGGRLLCQRSGRQHHHA